MKNSQGFSLMEILVAITIVAIVSAVSAGFVGTIQKNNRDSQRESDLRIIQTALQQYYADQNKFPNTLGTELSSGAALTNCSGRATPCTVSKTYLSKTPKDPTGTSYYFRPITNIGSPGSDCSISSGLEVGTCHYYYLCSKMENPKAGITSCYDTNYNFQVSPL